MLADNRYSTRYIEAPKAEGEYRILDNGVAESVAADTNTLLRIANVIRADEIVIADVMNETDATIETGKQFMRAFGAHTFTHAPKRVAAVVQGRSFAEWMKCINAYMYLPEFASVTTLMFPRCMNTAENGFRGRYHFLSAMFASEWWAELVKDRPMQVHCLGAASWIREVVMLRELPIRSIDTSMPVVLALEGLDIRKDVYVKRQEGYFDLKDVKTYAPLAALNVSIFRDWAGDNSDRCDF